jgi:hypothetical protein
MPDDLTRPRGINAVLAVLLAAALVALSVLGYLYYRQSREVVRIDVPGFQGSISKDKGVDIEVGKDKP